MRKINLTDLVENSNYKPEEIAKELFPDNLHPFLAYKRVARGDAVLDADQIVRLSDLLGVSIESLFSAGPWKMKTRNNLIILTNASTKTRIEINNKDWIARRYIDGKLKYDTIIIPQWFTVKQLIDLF